MTSPARYHTTVLLHEAIAGLDIKPDGVYVDATFGGGGHSNAILSALNQKGRLIAFDQDEDAWHNKPDDSRLIPVTENFRYLKRFLKWHGFPLVDGILADLGVSSFQLDTPERGFSTRFDGPADMRMDKRMEKTAADILQEYSEQALHKLLETYGEVRNARQLARHIVMQRESGKIQTLEAFRAMIAPVIRGNPKRYLAQVFQALRIAVNDELGALEDFLEQAADSLKPGGRLCIITFHSLEDRIVKQFFKQGKNKPAQDELYGIKQTDWILNPLHKKPITPSEEELTNNPRSGSAMLRIAEKI